MACTNCQNNNPCNQINPICVEDHSCECPIFISTDCSTLSEDLVCSGILKGQTETEVLKQLDAYICERFDSVENFFQLINVGTGVGIYKGISIIGKKELKTLLGSNLIDITQTTDEITISVNEAALNTFIEANQKTYSALNVGTGAGVYKDSTVVGDNTQFNLRKLKSSNSSVTITEGTDDIDLIVDGSETKLTAGTNVTITGSGTTGTPYIVNASGGGGSAPDATATVKGILKLTNDLGGTADLPTTPTAIHITGNEFVRGIKLFQNPTPADPSSISMSYSVNNGAYSLSTINSSADSTGVLFDNTGFAGSSAFKASASGILGDAGLFTCSNTGAAIRVALQNNTARGVLVDTVGTGNKLFVGQSSGVDKFVVTEAGNTTANSFIKSGGTAQQILLADGTVTDLNPQKVITTSYALTDADNGYTIFVNNASTAITITLGSITIPNFCVGFIQEGTADVTFVGVTNPVGLKIKGQGYQTFVERKLSTGSYFLLGNTRA